MNAVRRFDTGTIVVTPRAEAVLSQAGQSLQEFLRRHAEGDWTELNADQRALNEEGVRQGFNVVSHYRLAQGKRLMLVTLGDRSCTMIHVAPGSSEPSAPPVVSAPSIALAQTAG
jgi:hypothetical protein